MSPSSDPASAVAASTGSSTTADRPDRRRRLDPKGRGALFGAPVEAPSDSLRPGRGAGGKDALFSTGPRQTGTVIIECAGCHCRSRVSLGDVAGRLLPLSGWLPIPGVKHPHLLVCPACERRRWVRIGWGE